MTDTETHEIKINLPGLLRMLGENIYAEPDVAVREMIQNAHDTCIIRGTKDASFACPRIDIAFDRSQQTITISDNGAGMTEDELHNNLATIGESFTRIQRTELRDKDAREAALLIGQFGIGLLSAFSISSRVEVTTRSFQNDAACRWTCQGDIHYTVQACDKPDPGTQIVLHILDSKLELLDQKRLLRAIKRYADFLSVPIFLGGNQANVCSPPWEKAGESTNLSEYIQSRWGLFPLGIIPFDTDKMKADVRGSLPNVSGLLFIPMVPFELTRDFGELDIYISRMFIKADDKELLPNWARFVKGVINTPDLTPTLSRGEIITDEAYGRIRELLGRIIIGHLDYLQEEDPEKLKQLVGAFNNTIKARAMEDDDFFDRVCHLVRVSTDRGQITISDYLESSDGTLYYFAESGSGTQHKVLFAHKGLPVIDASWGVEEEFLEKYARRNDVKIERLASGAGAIFTIPESVDEKWRILEHDFSREVGKEAKAVQFAPETIPALLVGRPPSKTDKKLAELDAAGTQMGVSAESIKDMFRKLAESKSQHDAEKDTILHLNISNPLMRQLRDMPRNDTYRLAIACIFNNAHMFAHHYVSPANAEKIFDCNNQAFSAMISTAQALAKEAEERDKEEKRRAKLEIERDESRQRLPDISLSEYRSCFFAFDYKVDDNHDLADWLENHFHREDLGVKLLSPHREMVDLNIMRDLHGQLKTAHFGIAEVSNNNLNVLYEAGLLRGMGKPLLLLRRTDSEEEVPFDILSDYHVKYEVTRRGNKVQFKWLEEELEKAMNTIGCMLPTFQDVPKWRGE